MEQGCVDILLLESLSRFGQNMDEVYRYWQSLLQYGIRLHTAAEGEVHFDTHLSDAGDVRKKKEN